MLTDCATSWQVENRYANGVTLVHMDDGTAQKHPLQQGGHGHGVMFLGSEGWVHVDRSRMDAHPKSLLTAKIAPGEVHLFKSDNHHVNFIDAIKGRTKPAAPIDSCGLLGHLVQLAADCDQVEAKTSLGPGPRAVRQRR